MSALLHCREQVSPPVSTTETILQQEYMSHSHLLSVCSECHSETGCSYFPQLHGSTQTEHTDQSKRANYSSVSVCFYLLYEIFILIIGAVNTGKNMSNIFSFLSDFGIIQSRSHFKALCRSPLDTVPDMSITGY